MHDPHGTMTQTRAPNVEEMRAHGAQAPGLARSGQASRIPYAMARAYVAGFAYDENAHPA